MAQSSRAVLILVLLVALLESAGGQAPRSASAHSAQPQQKFFDDDPIQVMPAPLPVKNPAKQKISDVLDFLGGSEKVSAHAAKPAGAVNTLGEVPDSEWFVNRHGLHRMTFDELQRGPGTSESPVPPFTVIGGKTAGDKPGFRMKDSKGRKYFVKVDPLKYPELESSSDVIVSKFLYAIGYYTPENEIVNLKLRDLRLSDMAMITPEGERQRKMTWIDVEEIFNRVPHNGDGSFRIIASLAIEGENIGPFRYKGVRRDDPNDIVPHEDRRDLRGLYVFSAWLNNTDMKPTNTLDTVVTENGVRFIRHYQLDFGNALGSDGDAPKDARLGHEYAIPTPVAALEKIVSLGALPASWEQADYPKLRAVGNLESTLFNPDDWKPTYPNPAFLRRLPADDYWAAKQVMSFTDADIRAIVETGRLTVPQSAEYTAKTLAERRDKIGRTFFSKILPLDHFRVENAELLFEDLAVRYGFHAPRSYSVRWSTFDNLQQTHTPLSEGTAHLPVETIHAAPGSYFCAAIAASGDPLKPLSVYLRKEENGYKVVGVDRSW
jgi:hypothetical protein